MNDDHPYFAHDNFANSLGIRLQEAKDGYARCELQLNDTHKNGIGSVHGAVIFTLADIAFAAACNTGQSAIGMQADIKYLHKPEGNNLIAEANVVSASTRILHYQVDVTDSKSNRVARFSSIAYRFVDNNSDS